MSYPSSPSQRAEQDPSTGAATAPLRGVEALRARRGSETVTFNDVADHLVDFIERHPEARASLDALARFLARVEGLSHQHDGSGSSTVDDATV